MRASIILGGVGKLFRWNSSLFERKIQGPLGLMWGYGKESQELLCAKSKVSDSVRKKIDMLGSTNARMHTTLHCRSLAELYSHIPGLHSSE